MGMRENEFQKKEEKKKLKKIYCYPVNTVGCFLSVHNYSLPSFFFFYYYYSYV